MPRHGSNRTSITNKEGRSSPGPHRSSAPSCSPVLTFAQADQHQIYIKVKKHRAAKLVTAISKNKKDKQSGWVSFNRPFMLERHKIGTRESCL